MNHRLVTTFVLVFGLLVHQATADTPETWSNFHGVDGNGYVAEGTLPDQWSDADYAWRHKLPSRDVGSPVVAANKIFFLTSNPANETISVESLDLASGDALWSKQYPHPKHHLHGRNTFASSTPAADNKHLYVAWSNPEHTYLKCLDHAGNEIWSRDFGTWQSQHGFGTSPRIFGSMILLFNSQQADQLEPGQVAGQSRMIAVNRESGEMIWQTDLPATRSCYGVPAIFNNPDGTAQVIGADKGSGLFGLDAKTGSPLWNLEVFEMRCCATPLIVGDIAIGSSGSGGGGNHLVAVRIPQGKEQKPEQLYRIDRGAPYVPTPVVKGKHLFMVDDKGIASCIDATNGDLVWQERVGGKFGASPIVVNDKLLLISLDGEAVMLRASDQYELISRFDLGGPVGATPAFANGRLVLRVGDEIRCLKVR